MLKREALALVGGLSNPSKMPCFGWSTPAQRCQVGSRLRAVAGSTCSSCYALKGQYVFPNVRDALERRYGLLMDALSDVQKCETFVDAFVTLLADVEYFRWHDSGDVQSLAHLELIAEVALRTPGCMHWLPTREYRYVRQYLDTYGAFPLNLTVRLSMHMVGQKPPSWGLPTSGVHVTGGDVYGAACPAYTQGGYCGDCRACWDPDVEHVSYPKH